MSAYELSEEMTSRNDLMVQMADSGASWKEVSVAVGIAPNRCAQIVRNHRIRIESRLSDEARRRDQELKELVGMLDRSDLVKRVIAFLETEGYNVIKKPTN